MPIPNQFRAKAGQNQTAAVFSGPQTAAKLGVKLGFRSCKLPMGVLGSMGATPDTGPAIRANIRELNSGES